MELKASDSCEHTVYFRPYETNCYIWDENKKEWVVKPMGDINMVIKVEPTIEEIKKAAEILCAKEDWHFIENNGNIEIQMQGNGIATAGIEDGKFKCTIPEVGDKLKEIIKENREAEPEKVTKGSNLPVKPSQIAQIPTPARKAENKNLVKPRPIQELSLDEVRRFCNCPKADDDEVRYFVEVCWRRGLNIFAGDAYYVPFGGKHTIIVSKAAFLKKAEMNPQYDGMESGIIVKEGEGFKELSGSFYLGSSENIVGGWAKVYRKDRKMPAHVTVSMKEFAKNSDFWKDRPGLMITKVAEAHALRQAFPNDMGGLYQDSEIDVGGSIEI